MAACNSELLLSENAVAVEVVGRDRSSESLQRKYVVPAACLVSNLHPDIAGLLAHPHRSESHPADLPMEWVNFHAEGNL